MKTSKPTYSINFIAVLVEKAIKENIPLSIIRDKWFRDNYSAYVEFYNLYIAVKRTIDSKIYLLKALQLKKSEAAEAYKNYMIHISKVLSDIKDKQEIIDRPFEPPKSGIGVKLWKQFDDKLKKLAKEAIKTLEIKKEVVTQEFENDIKQINKEMSELALTILNII